MIDWLVDLMWRTAETGLAATVGTTLTAAALGKAENGNAVAPINAISHIAWGEEADVQVDASMKYTAAGLVLNAVAVTFWAGLYELAFGRLVDKGEFMGAALAGAAISAFAFVVDYYVVPKRFTPGFEKRLSGKSLFGIYAVLALSLGFGRSLVDSMGQIPR